MKARKFMPGLFAFAYPITGRGFERSRRVAMRAWVLAFQAKVRVSEGLWLW